MLSIRLSGRFVLNAIQRPLLSLESTYISRPKPFSEFFRLYTRIHCHVRRGSLRTSLLLVHQQPHGLLSLCTQGHRNSTFYIYSGISQPRPVSSIRRQHTQPEKPPDTVKELDVTKEDEEIDIYTAQTILSILDRAKQVWPCPKVSIPPGWSADWDSWDMLLSIYWTSPQYLMLPQIEMIFNIYFGIIGETRPIVYSTPDLVLTSNADEEERQGDKEYKSFVFTVVERPTEFYLLEFHDGPTLFKLSLPDAQVSSSQQDHQLAESQLVELLATPDRLTFELIPPSPEGSAALQRLLERDRTVIPELEQFLGYIPEHTEQREENPYISYPGKATKSSEKTESSLINPAEDEKIAEVNQLLKEIEARSPEFKEASQAWDTGMLDESSSLSDEEIDSDALERGIDAIGLKKEMVELESMMNSADGEMRKLDESLQETLSSSNSAPLIHESLGSLKVELDEANEDHMKLSVPFKEGPQKDSKSA